MKWSMSLSHTTLLDGGWVREQTVTDLPPCEHRGSLCTQPDTDTHLAKDLAAAEIAMAPFAYREL